MREENCIFCKIANGEIPSKTLYENDAFRVILDVGPATKGHALILPKKHFADLYELPEEMAAEVMKLAKKMAETIGISSRNVEANIKKLKKCGILIRHGSPKSGYWEIK